MFCSRKFNIHTLSPSQKGLDFPGGDPGSSLRPDYLKKCTVPRLIGISRGLGGGGLLKKIPFPGEGGYF